MPQPGDAHPVAHGEAVTGSRPDRDHLPDHLVAGGDTRAVHGQIALGDVQVGTAHPHARTATRSSSGPGRGTCAAESNSSGLLRIGPGRRTRQARIAVGTVGPAIHPWCNVAAATRRTGPIKGPMAHDRAFG